MTTAILLWWVTFAGVTDELSVDLGTVLSDVRRRPTGINVDYLMDDDRNSLLSPQRSLSEALRELGPGHLRYPGGWKSAINLWSVPPYASSRPILAGQVPDGWIRAGISLTLPDGSWRFNPLDFDEFMNVCRAIGAEPCVVVAYESCYWPPTRGWTPPSRERLIETAVFDALMRDNTLSPIGRALWIWNHFLGDEMVATTSSANIRCFASRKADQQLTVLLLNKDTAAREAAVTLQNLLEEFTQGEQWLFHGNGPSEQHPVWTGADAVRVTNSRILVRLAPVSVTVIVLEPGKLAADTTGPIAVPSPREVVSLDFDWRFHRGDIPATLAGNAAGGDAIPTDSPFSPAYDDSAWRKVDVPHDYIVEGAFDPKADTSHGSLPVEPAWYRRTIAVPAFADGRRLWLEFDGVYRDSRMWLNGRFLGRHASGYTSFRYDITDVARRGADNLLTVRVDPTSFEGWWYEGGGIYRHTRLVSVAPAHVVPWGVQVIATVPDPGDGMQADAGVALSDHIHEFRIQRLKEMGANAYRFSHHPMAPELLDACDRLGMLVMDENRNLGDSAEVLGQVESMVLRDRNHPCVILWSLCNEEDEQGSEKGVKQALAMIDVIKRLDPKRPITAAMNGGYGSGLTNVIDVRGFNYHPQDYDRIREMLPRKPMLATATAGKSSCLSMVNRSASKR